MSGTLNILWIVLCSVSLTSTTLLKNQVECIFLALLICRHLYPSCWFSRDILSLTKSLSENFKFESSWDLVPRFVRLYITDCFCLRHLNFIITLSDLFIQWQVCRLSGATLTPISDNALQTLASKASSCISAGTGFTLIISFLLYREFVTTLHPSWIILLRRYELRFIFFKKFLFRFYK